MDEHFVFNASLRAPCALCVYSWLALNPLLGSRIRAKMLDSAHRLECRDGAAHMVVLKVA